MLRSILKALIVVFATTLLLIITSIALCDIISQLQGSLMGSIISWLIIILSIVLYSKALGKIGNLIDRM